MVIDVSVFGSSRHEKPSDDDEEFLREDLLLDAESGAGVERQVQSSPNVSANFDAAPCSTSRSRPVVIFARAWQNAGADTGSAVGNVRPWDAHSSQNASRRCR